MLEAPELKRRGRPRKITGAELSIKRHDGRDTGFLRTTIVLPETVDSNLTLLCAQMGVSKSEYIRQLVCVDLIKHNLQPDKKPQKISVSY